MRSFLASAGFGYASLGLTLLTGSAWAQTTPAPIGMMGAPPRQGPRVPDVVAQSLPAALALEAAKAAVESCNGFQVGVSILDAAGLPKLYYIPDGTAGSHAVVGARKANTALLADGPSEKIVELTKTDKALSDKVTGNPAYIVFAGGLPIRMGGKVVGAIGVSGAEPSAKDEACAKDGLAKIQSRLK